MPLVNTGFFTITAESSSTLVVNNPSGVFDTHAGLADIVLSLPIQNENGGVVNITNPTAKDTTAPAKYQLS